MTVVHELQNEWHFCNGNQQLEKIYVEKQVQLHQKDVGCPVFLRLERVNVRAIWLDGTLVEKNKVVDGVIEYDVTPYIHSKEVHIKMEVANDSYWRQEEQVPVCMKNSICLKGDICLVLYEKKCICDENTSYYEIDEQRNVLLRVRFHNWQEKEWCKLLVTAYRQQQLKRNEETIERQVESKYYIIRAAKTNKEGKQEIDIEYDFEEEMELSQQYRFELLWMDKHGNVAEVSQVKMCNR